MTGSGDFETDELNLWAYRVDCSPEFQDSNFLGETHFADVIRFRRRTLSGLFQLFAREVVPGLDYRRAISRKVSCSGSRASPNSEAPERGGGV